MSESIRLGEQVNKIISQLKILINQTGGCCTNASISSGLNTNIPAGFNSVTITELTGSPVITFGNGNTYTLGTGEIFTKTAPSGTKFSSFTIVGGTWKWYAF